MSLPNCKATSTDFVAVHVQYKNDPTEGWVTWKDDWFGGGSRVTLKEKPSLMSRTDADMYQIAMAQFLDQMIITVYELTAIPES